MTGAANPAGGPGLPGQVIAIVGAESTGKSTLAAELGAALALQTEQGCTWVDEWLRRWCDAQGRTPHRTEQAGIAAEQARRIEQARRAQHWVVADTTPLMTAIYSLMLFDDDSLLEPALEAQQGYAATLLTANDIPWVADGLQRDGPHVREVVAAHLRQQLRKADVPWHLVSGTGAARLRSALAALQPLLRCRAQDITEPAAKPVVGQGPA